MVCTPVLIFAVIALLNLLQQGVNNLLPNLALLAILHILCNAKMESTAWKVLVVLFIVVPLLLVLLGTLVALGK